MIISQLTIVNFFRKTFLIVARAKGHRRYYGAVLTEESALIYRQEDEKRIEIVRKPYDYKIDHTYDVEFKVKDDMLTMLINGKIAAEGKDSMYSRGQAGFVVDAGAILGDGFEVRRL